MIHFVVDEDRFADEHARMEFELWLRCLHLWLRARPSTEPAYQWRRQAFLCSCGALGSPNAYGRTRGRLTIRIICPCGKRWEVVDG